jgi:dTDP-glucose 4,6-dehydratase
MVLTLGRSRHIARRIWWETELIKGKLRSFKRILVTGGAGFIGSNYLNALVRSHPDVLFVNMDALTYAGNLENLTSVASEENYRFEKGNITDSALVSDLFNRYSFDGVVHFAAESHVDRSISDPTDFVRTNVDGTLVLLQAARMHWEREGIEGLFHHVSTDEVFGSLGATGHFTPDSPYAPRSPYAASKASADHLVRSFGITYGLPYVITNTSNNYGPYQFPEKLIPLVLSNAQQRKPIPIYGKGDNVRDWLYVGDHCSALEKVLFGGRVGATYLIGGSQEMSNLDLVHALLDVYDELAGNEPGFSRDLITFVRDRAGHDFRYAIDSSATQNELGWSPEHSLSEGLRKTVLWYMEHPEWLSNILNETYLSYYESQYGQR